MYKFPACQGGLPFVPVSKSEKILLLEDPYWTDFQGTQGGRKIFRLRDSTKHFPISDPEKPPKKE